MRRFALTVLLLLAGCTPTRIPPLPEAFDTVALTSPLTASTLYADAVAAFFRANWEPITPDEEGLAVTIRPDGMDTDGTAILVRVRVVPVGADDPDAPLPELADPDYGVPDLARRELEDASREQNDPDSLRAATDPSVITQGEAVLTATVDASKPGARDVLVRTARILTSVDGTLSYHFLRSDG